jgi:hypothetical protein
MSNKKYNFPHANNQPNQHRQANVAILLSDGGLNGPVETQMLLEH